MPSALFRGGERALWRLHLRPGGGGRALLGDVLAEARSVDIDEDRVHREPIEDRGGERRVAEVPAPIAERDVARDRGRDATVSSVDEVVERVRCGRLVVALLDLTKADIIDDEELRAGPAFEAPWIRAVGDRGMEIVEEVDTASVTHADALLAGAKGEGFEDVALAGAGLAGDHDVPPPANEVEAGELDDGRSVELRLEVEVERLEGLSLLEPAAVDAIGDALIELFGDLGGEDVLEERGGPGPLAGRPREMLVERRERVR